MHKYLAFGDWLKKDPSTDNKFLNNVNGLSKDAMMSYLNFNRGMGNAAREMVGLEPNKNNTFSNDDFHTGIGSIIGKAGSTIGETSARLAPTLMGMPSMSSLGKTNNATQPQEQQLNTANTGLSQGALNGNDAYQQYQGLFANGGPLTHYNTGGTHEQNRFGGIPVGNQQFVEEGEFKFKDPDTGEDYIFSNRF
jgi:hypothetical protein